MKTNIKNILLFLFLFFMSCTLNCEAKFKVPLCHGLHRPQNPSIMTTENGLSLSIKLVSYEEEYDCLTVDLILDNQNEFPICLWERWNSWGAYQWYFEAKNTKGEYFYFENWVEGWTENYPSQFQIESKSSFIMKCQLLLMPIPSSKCKNEHEIFCGDLVVDHQFNSKEFIISKYKKVISDKNFTLRAVYENQSIDGSEINETTGQVIKYDGAWLGNKPAWVGQIASEWVNVKKE